MKTLSALLALFLVLLLFKSINIIENEKNEFRISPDFIFQNQYKQIT